MVVVSRYFPEDNEFGIQRIEHFVIATWYETFDERIYVCMESIVLTVFDESRERNFGVVISLVG